MLSKNIQTYMACDTDFCDADIIMFGAPFDGTTSFRPGTRFAPSKIREDSYGLETYSPYQDKDLTNSKICDTGDIELCFGNAEKVLSDIKSVTKEILASNKLPFMVGGEHLVTLGAFSAVQEKYPEVFVVHFDAHTDLRDDYLGEKLSHACVIKRIYDIIGDGRIFQHGIRSGEKYEFDFAKNGHTELYRFNLDNIGDTIEKLKGKKVYFTVDLDVLDPSVFCGTGTPEPGGVSFDELRFAVTEICKNLDIVGCDVNELSPHYDQSGASTAVACKIIREMLLALTK